MRDFELDAFEEYFYHDLEKGFSADIACCDNCHADFLSMWPFADYADGHYFQTTSIDLDTFYSGSYLQDQYSKADFDRLICKLDCPRCGSPLGGNIWAYNLPFNVPEDFERTIREVGETACATPFLLLENEFCRKVLGSIRSLAAETKPQRIKTPLFRGRSEVRGPVSEELSAFDFPPSKYVQEGRYNHAGHSVLYLGSDIDTCHAELRQAPSLIVEFELLAELRTLDLIDPYPRAPGKFEDADLLNCLVYSALLSARQDDDGWHRPHYVVSRFVADCARASGLDAIRYPSTRRTECNFNLVIVNPMLSLSNVGHIIQFHRRSRPTFSASMGAAR